MLLAAALHETQLTISWTSKSQRKLTQITADATNDPCYYSKISCTSINVHIYALKFLFRNGENLEPETLNPDLLCKAAIGLL
jgi:hypothetical protein